MVGNDQTFFRGLHKAIFLPGMMAFFYVPPVCLPVSRNIRRLAGEWHGTEMDVVRGYVMVGVIGVYPARKTRQWRVVVGY